MAEEDSHHNILHLINVRWYNACAYYALALASAQKRLGHKVMLAGDPDNPYISLAKDWGLEFDVRPRFSSYFPNLVKNMLWLKQTIEENDFDVVVAHRGEAHTAAVLTKIFLKAKFPLIRVRGDARSPRRDLYNKMLYQRATDGIICTTDILCRQYINSFDIDAFRVRTIPAGIDYEYYQESLDQIGLKRKYGLPIDCLIITLLGRLSPIKGHKVFIDMAGMLKDLPCTHFLIAGHEVEVKSHDLKWMIEKNGCEGKFTILGLVDDVREVLQVTDIAVIPSLGSEMIARVALEFMASGKPIVASNINALSETIDDGEGGYLVAPGDARGFAEAIRIILTSSEKRTSFGEHNRKQAQTRFSAKKWAEDSIEFYEGFIKRKRRSYV